MRALVARYFSALAAIVVVIGAACLIFNVLVDPLWYFNGNAITGVSYAFNERIAKMVRFLPRMADYDCLLIGSSHTALLPADRIEGHRCYNMGFSHGRVREFALYAEYIRARGFRPSLITINVDKYDFEENDPPKVPDFIRAGSAPPSFLVSYLSLDALDFSIRTLRGDFPNRLVYDRNFNMHIIPRRRYRAPAPPKTVPPFNTELAQAFIDLRHAFPEARAIGFAPPISVVFIRRLKDEGKLDMYLGALERIAPAFDVFLDFSIPSEVTTSTTNTYDGDHYIDEVNEATAAALSSGRTDIGADWRRESAASIRARYAAKLAEPGPPQARGN